MSDRDVEIEVNGDPLDAVARVLNAGLSGTRILYERDGQWSLALGALVEICVTGAEVRLQTAGGEECRVATASPLHQVAGLLDDLRLPRWRAFGWSAFELAYLYPDMDGLPADQRLLYLVIPEREARFSPGTVSLSGFDQAGVQEIRRLLATSEPAPPYRTAPVDVHGPQAATYLSAVDAAVRAIRERRLQKVILSRTVDVDYPVDLVGTYVVGRRANTPARSFFVDAGGVRAAGFSPEIVLEVTGEGCVRTQPLAGTRALTGQAGEDARLRAELLGDTKEIFEHTISVKVAFDEMAALCAPCATAIESFMTVERRGSVQHLASLVRGRLPSGVTLWDAFAALFPAVTVSGVPKRVAFDVLREHEAQPRGLYGGAVFTVDSDGAMDAALVLRTVFQDEEGRAHLRAGAGIVEQSTPERELEETCEKLRSVARYLVRAGS